MPRRRALTGAQLAGLLALPATEAELARHWVLGDADLAAVGRRRRDHNRLGFALQLCALRYPGRPLRPGEAVPQPALRFVADQVGAAPEAVAAYGTRTQTRSAHLDELRDAFGFADLTPGRRRELAAWLLPVALATTSAMAVAAALLEETRLDPACTEGVHPERLRRLAREGGRFTAQHLRALSPLRRRATLAATVLDTTTRLTDDGVGTFDRAVGRMFRRAELAEGDALLRDARAVNDKVRLLARLGAALIAARDGKSDLEAAVADAIGWDRLARSVAEAERLARPDRADLPALAARAWPVLRRLGPTFLGAFRLQAIPAAAATLRAVEALREAYASGGRRWPGSLPASFLRPAWRDAVHDAGGDARRVWEAATLLALRDRLRAGDIWVEGSRQWRAVEDQLIPPALFAAMRDAGPLPVAVPATAEAYLADRRATLDRRLAEVAAKAAANRLEDVRIAGDALRISPLKAATPEEAEALAERLYAAVPAVRITDLLAEVDRWTGFGAAFTHPHSGLPASDRRVVLTAVLADATNLGLTRMADACAVATYRQLAWTAGWHLRGRPTDGRSPSW